MKKTFYCFALFFIIVYAYNGYQLFGGIDLKVYNKGKLSAITESVYTIPLETVPGCHLYNIKKIRFAGSHLFISSQGGLFQFTDKGEFIRELSGTTPIVDFAIDTNKQYIITIEEEQRISYYNFDGVLLSSAKQTKQPLWEKLHKMDYYNDSLWVTADILLEETDITGYPVVETRLCQYDTSFNLLESRSLSPANTGRKAKSFYLSPEPAVTEKGEVYAYSPSLNPDYLVEDTLFIARTEGLTPNKLIHSGNVYPVKRSSRFMLATYHNQQEEPCSYSFCYDKKENKAYYSKEGFEDDLLHTGVVNDLCALNMQNTSFCFIKKSSDTKGLYPNRTEQENPVLFIFHLKA